jgi:Saxitoxin biosynthesis operon protein SxtJ
MATVLEPSLVRGHEPESTDRSFGFVFAAVFAIIGCWPLLYWETPRLWALGIAIAFAAVAFARPNILRPLNRAWLAFGRLLHRVMNPLILGGVFFLCVTPIAYIMRLLGKDVLSLSHRPDLTSYWITRPPSPPASETMKQQF